MSQNDPASLPLVSKRSKEKRRRQARAERTAKARHETLEEFLVRHNVKNDWHVLIFSDGSGSTWDQPMGWGAVMIRRDKGKTSKTLWCGSANYGTVSVAEIMGVLQPLTFLESEAQKFKKRFPFLKVVVFTDSEYVRNMGSAVDPSPKANAALWAMIGAWKRQGLRIEWRWLPAGDGWWNVVADEISKLARINGSQYDPIATARNASQTAPDASRKSC
jgi:ribonuclease HI